MNLCPECNSHRLIPGRTTTTAPGFRPKGLRPFCFTVSELQPKFGNKFVACLDCGLVWSLIDKDDLTRLLTEKGTKKTKMKYRLTNS